MNPWTLVYEGFDPAAEGLREALCTLGNGYFATRGATPDGDGRYAGTYAAGCYDRLTSTVAEHTVTNEGVKRYPRLRGDHLTDHPISGRRICRRPRGSHVPLAERQRQPLRRPHIHHERKYRCPIYSTPTRSRTSWIPMSACA